MTNGNATGGEATVAALTVRLPTFNASNPEVWFVMVESQFATAGIKADATKFHHVIGALDPKYVEEILDIISSPENTGNYTLLKKQLIERLSVSQQEKTRKLLEGETVGDKKPSQFLRHLQRLGGKVLTTEMLRSLWLGGLPQNMQIALAAHHDKNVEQLAEMADAIKSATSSATSGFISEATCVNPVIPQSNRNDDTEFLRSQISALQATVNELVKTNNYLHRSRSRSRGRFGSSQRDQSTNSNYSNHSDYSNDGTGECWYHHKFGDKARKCKPPCTRPQGNVNGSR